jgi:hypothetical protein
MKKVLIVHFGSWLDERDTQRYQHEVDELTKFLEKDGISVEQLDHLPDDCEIAACAALVFLCISFKKDAKKIKSETEKPVFIITGLVEKGDDEFGITVLNKSVGYFENAKRIKKELCPTLNLLIRTNESSVANRDDMTWRPLTEIENKAFASLLDENPQHLRTLENGFLVTINRFNGILTQDIRKA